MDYLKPSPFMIHEEQTDKNDPRVKHIINAYEEGKKYDVGILGVPFDYGVELSRGRVGAREGPSSFRMALKRYGTTYNIEQGLDISKLRICDFGDVQIVDRDSIETHRRVSEIVAQIIKKGILPVVIGGGHDISFANAHGLCKATNGKIGVINIDGHFDVRKIVNRRISSGTHMRRILEELNGMAPGKNSVEIGAHDNLNSKIYHGYLKDKRATVITLDMISKAGMQTAIKNALNAAGLGTKASFLTVDMDAMPQNTAPGCSAPSARGIEAADILTACFAAGADSKLKLFDIMELNPTYDVDNRTAILSATMFVSFLNGFSTREKGR
jgi:formimidoylglutamase